MNRYETLHRLPIGVVATRGRVSSRQLARFKRRTAIFFQNVLAAGKEMRSFRLRKRGHSLVVKRYPSKLDMRVRFPLPAPIFISNQPPTHMKKTTQFALIGAALGLLSNGAYAAIDCQKLSSSIKDAVSASQSSVLEIVQVEVAANPGCACEVVKAAIEASNADAATVASIVEVAATAAPEQMRLISQCAVAVAPDALAGVEAVLAKIDPSRGESGAVSYSAKGAKDAGEVVGAVLGNPLDFPGQSPGQPPVVVGTSPGSPGGFPLLPPGPPIFVPPIVNPPSVTP
jgi:hypothetical protein